MSRTQRLNVLTHVLHSGRYGSQHELVRALAKAGSPVTQATLSRDLRSLGVVKRPGSNGGSVYELPQPASESLDRQRQLLDLRTFVNEVRVASNLVVIRTPPGHANAVARAVDLMQYPGFVGSVAGDDTMLVVMSGTGAARKLKRHLDSLSGASLLPNGDMLIR
ncbi:MAG TPA: arginine repressor [Candidatus Eisenbacteria bacterium]|nr:arginine repressor [Candidatus Eisenbacteria bacterium]